SSRRRHTRFSRDWSSDVCSSDLATLVSIFTAFPAALIAALAGLALLAAISGALAGAMAVPDDREAALITFLVTASDMSFLGLSRSEERRVGHEWRYWVTLGHLNH